jgi:transcriptional regulator with GAF, ATPase, and Fis domain
MPTENLNIEHHTKELLIRALNKYRTVYEAAAALGVSERTLHNLKQQYNIVRKPVYVVQGKYKIVNTF